MNCKVAKGGQVIFEHPSPQAGRPYAPALGSLAGSMLRGRAFAEDECHCRCERSRGPWPRQKIPRFHSFKMFHDHHFSTFFHIFPHFSTFFHIFPHFSTFFHIFPHFSTFHIFPHFSYAWFDLLKKNPGRTALHCAAHNGNTSVAQLLLANGAKVDETDGEGLLSRSPKMLFATEEEKMHRQNQTQMGEERTRCLISSFHQWFAMV